MSLTHNDRSATAVALAGSAIRSSARAAVALLALSAAGWAGTAWGAGSGSHSPASATKTAIVAAINDDHAVGPPSLYTVVDIRVASGNQYARADTAPADRADYQGQIVILHLSRRRWRVTDFGTAGVGCALPRDIQKDLDVHPPASYCKQAG
jgi:hypothetical protein